MKKKRGYKIIFLLLTLSALASCGSKGGSKSKCDDDGVCRIGYKIDANSH